MGGLIPLSDASRQTRRFPAATVFIIVINVIVFALELAGGDAFVMRWSAIPADITSGHHWINLLSSMFMHASWSHIIGNMVFLWAFGPEIEEAMGPLRYLIYYLSGGFVASLCQIAATPHSTMPSLGASGAIAAVMGAFLVTYPGDRIKSVLFSWLVCPRHIHPCSSDDWVLVPYAIGQSRGCRKRHRHEQDRRRRVFGAYRRIDFWRCNRTPIRNVGNRVKAEVLAILVLFCLKPCDAKKGSKQQAPERGF